MAYKDEYEVARLHLDARERQRVVDEFGEKADVRVMLHPPILRAMGLKRKLRLGRSAFGTFRVLCGMRRLRGTKLDPFGYAEVRRVERAIIPEYRAIVDDALEDLRPETTDQVRAIAALPDVVRGYEGIKLANVAEFRRRAEQSLKELSTLGENAHSDLEEGMGNEKARYG
jgi:indolepyruvate ferredoxin oxidoreductase